MFDLLKAHLKRAPSLRGAALVRLASLKFQAKPWAPLVLDRAEALARLEEVREREGDEALMVWKINPYAILILIYSWR